MLARQTARHQGDHGTVAEAANHSGPGLAGPGSDLAATAMLK